MNLILKPLKYNLLWLIYSFCGSSSAAGLFYTPTPFKRSLILLFLVLFWMICFAILKPTKNHERILSLKRIKFLNLFFSTNTIVQLMGGIQTVWIAAYLFLGLYGVARFKSAVGISTAVGIILLEGSAAYFQEDLSWSILPYFIPLLLTPWIYKRIISVSGLSGLTRPAFFSEEKKELSLSQEMLKLDSASTKYLKKDYFNLERQKSGEELQAVLQNILEILFRFLPGYSLSLCLAHEDHLEVQCHKSLSSHFNPSALIPFGQGILGLAAKEKKTILVNDFSSDARTLCLYREPESVHSVLCAPLLRDPSLLGILAVDSLESNAFTEQDKKLVEKFSEMIAKLITDTMYKQRFWEAEKSLTALYHFERECYKLHNQEKIITFLDETIEKNSLLKYDRLILCMINPENKTAEILLVKDPQQNFKAGQTFSLDSTSLTSLIYKNNCMLDRQFKWGDSHRYLFSPQEPVATRSLYSFLGAPIPGDEGCLGALCIESVTLNGFPESDKNLLSQLAISIGIALSKARLYEKMQNMATRDSLTSLLNHRTFVQQLGREVRRAGRLQNKLGLLVTDIDHFKKINDTYGHPTGDFVLTSVARILENSIRENVDFIARYGGEEFTGILIESDEKQSWETAERIRSLVEKTVLQVGQQEIRITMSFGVAVFPDHAGSLEDLIHKADQALYRAKKNGRNQVSSAAPALTRSI